MNTADHFTNDREARAFLTAVAEPDHQALADLVAEEGPVAAATRLLTGTLDAPLAKRLTPRIPRTPFRKNIDRWQAQGIHFDIPGDDGYPTGLSDLPAPPVGLWRRGQASTKERHIGIVGARACTGYGERVTDTLVHGLVTENVGIVAGLAFGIDGAAHRATLDAGGTTIAFMAGGLDRVYPIAHDMLFARMLDHGGVAYSEVAPETSATKWRFLARNRLIAAASDAVVVVEAGTRSGSLSTARHATTLPRPLGTVPGPVDSPVSAGCHRLLRDHGATAVTTPEEALQLLP